MSVESQPQPLTLDHRATERKGLALAALIGFGVGLLAVAFQIGVQYAEQTSQNVIAPFAKIGPVNTLIVVAIGAALGGLAGWMTQRYCPEAGGSGIPYIKAVLMNLRPMRPARVVTVKAGGGLLALLSGMSLGREGPTVQMGGSIGAMVATGFKVPERLRLSLIASGAGAGLAAAFNAPLAGFIFVMEELRREMSPLTYGMALFSSVCAVAVSRILLGQEASFVLKDPQPVPLRALIIVVILGACSAFIGIAFNRLTLRLIEFREKHLGRTAGGAIVGAAASLCVVYAARIVGSGHGLAEALLSHELAPQHLITFLGLLLLGKILLTSSSFATGVPGGIFAPLLAIGALTGNLIGSLAGNLFPHLGIQPDVFATIGMAAVLTGATRVPLTGVVLIVEMTQQYSLLYALLVGAFTAYIVANLMGNEPIYEALLERELHKDGSHEEAITESINLELSIEPDSAWDGAQIKDVTLPAGAVIAMIRRANGFVAPRGATRLAYGDEVSIYVIGQTPQKELVALHDATRAPHPSEPVSP